MRFIILGSGSTGNALYVESGETGVLIDAGFTARETRRRMQETGIDPTRLKAIVVTHEHTDHIKGVRLISKGDRKNGFDPVPVFMSEKVRSACPFPDGGRDICWGDPVYAGEAFRIGPLKFRPFSVPHDSIDAVAFTVEAEGMKIGIATDLGEITQVVSYHLAGADLLVIEANHNLDMLKASDRPWHVKQRIYSDHGHLSNDQTARWLEEEFDGQARHIVLAHLSRKCNYPDLARMSAEEALQKRGFTEMESRLRVAAPDVPSEWFEL